jgi:predicted  nucleic acid-binding Zn-ribbon protein
MLSLALAGHDIRVGSVRVLGLPVALDGTVDVGSLVDSVNATGHKTLAVKNLALPSIADILAALGLDLSKLPTKTLTDLVDGLNLTNTAITTAQQALTAAEATVQSQLTALQSQIDAANADLLSKTSALTAKKVELGQAQAAVTAAQSAVTAANAAVTTAQAQFDAAAAPVIAAATPLGLTADQYAALNPVLATVQTYNAAKATLTSAQAAAATAATNLTNAQSAAQALQVAVDTLQAAVDAAKALINTLTSQLNALLGQFAPQINALLAAVTAVLDGTPLVSVDSFTVETQAVVKSASAGGQTAKVVGGEIQGVHVLGTDVLNNVLGSSKVNVLDLVGSTLTQVTSKVDALNGVLSSVLSAVPGLSIPAPQVDLLTKSTSTSIANGFGYAQNSVNALSVTLPAITLPAALALPSAASLPAISGAPDLKGALGINAVGDLTSQAVTMRVGTLSEQSSFSPGSTTPTSGPGASGPPLATTRMPAGIAVIGFLLVGFGLVVRRRFATQASPPHSDTGAAPPPRWGGALSLSGVVA